MNNTQQKSTAKKMDVLKPVLIIISAVALVGLIWFGVALYNFLSNRAADVVKPFENALVKAGARKQCTRGDSGRGPDNSAPNYMALYEVPGKTDAAIALVQNAAKESGFNFTEGPYPPNPGSSKYYSDKTSKQSPYTDLEPGNIILIMSADENTKYSGDQYCTILKKKSGSDQNKTTVDLTVNLPSFKR